MLNTDFYLFIYDIHTPRVLRKLVKLLDGYNSMRIQKSVFEIQGSLNEIITFINKAKLIIEDKTDKIALIPLCQDDYSKVEFFGLLSRRPEKEKSFQIL